KGQRVTERGEPSRGEGQIRLEQSLEFQERLVIEGYVVDLVRSDACLLKAGHHGLARESRVVLLSREPFLLGRRDDATVHSHGGRGVGVVGGDAENFYGKKKRV